jgi:carboxypeptidase T
MKVKKNWCLLIILMVCLSVLICDVAGANSTDTTLIRVNITKADDIVILETIGFFPIVEEPFYTDGWIEKSKIETIQRAGYGYQSISGDELIHRLVRINIPQMKDVNKLADLDIWNVQDTYIIASVYDSDIRTVKKSGFEIEILFNNTRDYIDQVEKNQIQSRALKQGLSPETIEYHSYDSLRNDLVSLENNYPNIAKVIDIGDSWENRDILALKISDNVGNSDDPNEPDILFMGNHHAKEWISVEVPYYLAKYLVEHYSTDNKVRQLVDNNEIWVIPMVNPDGLNYSRISSGTRDWRKNRRDNGDTNFGVDLNRNYGYMWGGEGSSNNTESLVYRGPDAFSEPETIAIRDLINSPTHQFTKSLSYHSYTELVLYPWDYTKNPPLHHVQFTRMADKMKVLINSVNNEEYTAGQSPNMITYPSSGTTDDWLYGEHQIAAFEIELRPNSTARIGDVLVGFLLPADQIIPTFEENLPAALYLINWSQTINIVSPTSANPFQISKPLTVIVDVFDTDGAISGYEGSNFSVSIDGKIISHTGIESGIPGRYTLSANLPADVSPGTHILKVSIICVGGKSEDIEQITTPSMFRANPQRTGVYDDGGTRPNNVLKWKYTTRAPVESSPAISNGVVYVGSNEGNVYAFNATTGSKLWNYTAGGVIYSSPAISNGVIYIGRKDVFALNASTGMKIWNYSNGYGFSSSPAIANGVVYIGGEDSNAYALDASSGKKLWNFTTEWKYNFTYSVSTPAVDNGIVYFGNGKGIFYALNASTGSKIWESTIGYVWGSPAIADGVVYVKSTGNNTVFAFNALTGSILWKTTLDGHGGYGLDSSPAVANGMIYIGGDEYLYALNVSTGIILWNSTSGFSRSQSSPAIANGVVYVGSENNNLYAFNATTGEKIWNYTTQYEVRSSPVVANGVVYFGSMDRNVYAVGNQTMVTPLIGFSNPPTDPDSDGLYEDLNANNRKDFNDIVLMFNQMQWIAANEPISAFDFNGNGRIDFNDIVKLFGEI